MEVALVEAGAVVLEAAGLLDVLGALVVVLVLGLEVPVLLLLFGVVGVLELDEIG